MLIEYSEPSIFKGLSDYYYPDKSFSYNAQTGELTVNHNIEFRLNFTPGTSVILLIFLPALIKYMIQ